MAASHAIREQSYYVLASLLDGPQHGYGIIKETLRLTHGDVRLAPGTLYGAIERLVDAGLLEKLAHRRILHRLSEFDLAAGKAPQARVGRVGAPHEQGPAFVNDNGDDGGDG